MLKHNQHFLHIFLIFWAVNNTVGRVYWTTRYLWLEICEKNKRNEHHDSQFQLKFVQRLDGNMFHWEKERNWMGEREKTKVRETDRRRGKQQTCVFPSWILGVCVREKGKLFTSLTPSILLFLSLPLSPSQILASPATTAAETVRHFHIWSALMSHSTTR